MIRWASAASIRTPAGLMLLLGLLALAAPAGAQEEQAAPEAEAQPKPKRVPLKKKMKPGAEAADPADPKEGAEEEGGDDTIPMVVRPDNKTLAPLVRDLQSADQAVREAAAKQLVQYGAYVYQVVQSLRRHSNKTVVALAEQIAKDIDAEALRRFKIASKIYRDTYTKNYTPEALEKLYNVYTALNQYVVNRMHKSQANAMTNRIRVDLHRAKLAVRTLADSAKQLEADPPPRGLVRAALQKQRATHLQNLRKYDDALAAVADAMKANDGGERLLPSLLLQQAQLLEHKGDTAGMLAACERLLKECPRSLEVRDAYEMQVSHWEMEEDYAKEIAALGAYLDRFPVDGDAEDLAYQTLDLLMDMEYKYAAAGALTKMMIEKLPLSRLKPEVPYFRALIAEFVERDYPAAGQTWAFLLKHYPDRETDGRFAASIERVRQKTAGTWPKSPAVTDEGPAGALARFQAAARAYDSLAVQKEVPADETDDWDMKLDEFVADLAFSDLLVLKSTVDEKAGTAMLQVEQRLVEEPKPVVGFVRAVKEGGAWKIVWPEDLSESEDKPAVPGGFVPPTQLPEKKAE